MALIGETKAHQEIVKALQDAHYILEQRYWLEPMQSNGNILQALKDTKSGWWASAFTQVVFTIDPTGRSGMTVWNWEKDNPTKEMGMQLLRDTIKRVIEQDKQLRHG